MRAYASQQVASRLSRLVFEMRRSARRSDPDTIHDLRVAIRRLLEALRVFKALFPRRARKRIEHRLRPVIELAAEVRDRDVALELCGQAGIRSGSALLARLTRERTAAARVFTDAMKRLKGKDLAGCWRSHLQL